MTVTGVNFVRFTRHGLQAIRAYWKRTGDRFEVRRQALKLRFWDERHLHPPGMLFDGLVQKGLVLGNSTDHPRPCLSDRLAAGSRELIPGEAAVAEQFQPVRLRRARQQFRRALAHPLGVLTAQERRWFRKNCNNAR